MLKLLLIKLWQVEMELKRDEEGDRALNELMLEVQHQFSWCKENTSKKFQKLGELIDLAVQKMRILKMMKANKREEGLKNPCGWKFKEEQGNLRPSGRYTHESLQNLRLNFPKFNGADVDDWLKDCEQYSAVFDSEDSKEATLQWYQEYARELMMGKSLQDEPQNTYALCNDFQIGGLSTKNGARLGALFDEGKWSDMDTEASITTEEDEAAYDELPGEDKKDWHSEEIICIALGLEDCFEPNQNLEEGTCTDAKGGECISYLRKPFPSVSPAAVAYVPRKVPNESGSVGNLSREHSKLFGEGKDESDMKLWSSGHGDMPKIVGNYKVEEKQGAREVVSSMITTNKGDIAQVFFSTITCKDFPTADSSYGLTKRSSKIGEKNVLIFDPGGYVHSDQSRCVTKKLIEMIRCKVKLDEADLIISVDGELRHLKGKILKFLAIDKEHSHLTREVFIVQIVDSARIRSQNIEEVGDGVSEIDPRYVDHVRVGLIAIPNMCIVLKKDRRGSLVEATRLEIDEALGKKVFITIFDPGGNTLVYEAQLIEETP